MALGVSVNTAQDDGVVRIDPLEQKNRLRLEELQCLLNKTKYPKPNLQEPYCKRTWDSIICWPDVPAGKTVRVQCPDYITGFYVHGFAQRECMPDGTWYFHLEKNKTWSNYSQCIPNKEPETTISPFTEEHLARIVLLSNVGYGISLISLLVAVGIMVYFKKLHCTRNTVHLNLFLSFILRASLAFLRENLMVDGLGLPIDVTVGPNGTVTFNPEGTHWQCKLLLTTFNYATTASYTWIFMEGVYLHIIIFVSVFSDRKCSAWWYILAGWSFPLVSILPWVIVRAVKEDKLCWNTHTNKAYFWILRGPATCTIVINFVFFLNLVRILFTKLRRTNHPEAKKYRYLKLARSIAVLIPLFGVHYIVFVGLPEEVSPCTQVVRLYWEMFFNSFQGFLVALLLCFFNHEVQTELRRRWHRFRIRRMHSAIRRNSRTTSTFMAYSARQRQHQLARSQQNSSSPKDTHMANSTIDETRPIRIWRSNIGNNNIVKNYEEQKSLIEVHPNNKRECHV